MSLRGPRRAARLRGILIDIEPLRRDRDFRLLWVGQLVSGFGRQVTVVALPYQLYVLTGSALAVGLLAVVQLIAILTFALGGGAIADAVDRRRLLLITQLGLAGSSLGLVALALTPDAPVVLYYVVAFAAAGIGAVDQPARSSALPRLVPRERLPAAISLGQLSFQTVGVVGPALGGIMLATIGVAAAFAFDVATFGAAVLALLLMAPIKPLRGAIRPSLAAIAEGLSFARRRRIVLGTFVIDLDAMIFGMPTSLFPALALDVFKVGPIGVGLMTAAPAAGALVGTLVTGWTTTVRRPGRAVVVAVAGWGLAILGFGVLVASFPLALVCLALAGAADVFSAVLRSGIVQFETPDELRGRVMSIHTLVVTSGPRLGDAEAALVAAVVGPQLSVISGGVMVLLGLGWVVRKFPELMHYQSPIASGHPPVPETASAGD
jgi:MFS family permease